MPPVTQHNPSDSAADQQNPFQPGDPAAGNASFAQQTARNPLVRLVTFLTFFVMLCISWIVLYQNLADLALGLRPPDADLIWSIAFMFTITLAVTAAVWLLVSMRARRSHAALEGLARNRQRLEQAASDAARKAYRESVGLTA